MYAPQNMNLPMGVCIVGPSGFYYFNGPSPHIEFCAAQILHQGWDNPPVNKITA